MDKIIILGKYYRKATDWIKPTIDKVIDPIAIVVGANFALSLVIYFVNQEILQAALFTIFDGKLFNFIDRHKWIEFILKAIAYCLIYGFVNLEAVIPAALRMFKRTSVPSWKNHLKTMAIIAVAIISWNFCGVKHDFYQIKWRIKNAEGFFDTIGAVFNATNIRTIDRYMSGVKGTRIAVNAWQLFGYSSGKEIAKEIERECRRIRKSNIATPNKIANDAAILIKHGLIDNPAQLIYITRVLYFEGAFDPEARSLDDIKEGLTGIASVMYNRYLFDTGREKIGQPRAFSNNGDNLYDIVFYHAPNNKGGITWQFSAIPINNRYFNGKQHLTLSSGKMNSDRTLLCYKVLMEVLTEKRYDNTNAALFYQNPGCVDRHNRNWKQRGLNDVKKINSHVYFRPTNLSENWREHTG
jgi:hypothetical protein